AQKRDVLEKAALIGTEATRAYGAPDALPQGDVSPDAFVTPMLFHCEDPDSATVVHSTEAFGPVSTIMGYRDIAHAIELANYRDIAHAIELANKGEGSLVASVITGSGDVAREMAMGAGAFHGRLYFNNAHSMKESTGHGSPLPHMVHGGPGRAGGGEEMGGVRGVLHYMQRTAIQGSPDILSAIGGRWVPGSSEVDAPAHPFTRRFNDLAIGETIHTAPRTVTLEDIDHFAHFTGDTFYAHMDDEAAKRNPFFPGRVAHGYLLLSFAAGLFVDPDEGPVLANTGLDNLRFMTPVSAGESIQVRLTVKAKTRRTDEYGEVRWHVTLTNQDDAMVAEYELLTMVAY
ncbi:MAG: phenylacetic acid degradation bifunctional protein PaaZ, partial [Rhodobacterales bacterium]